MGEEVPAGFEGIEPGTAGVYDPETGTFEPVELERGPRPRVYQDSLRRKVEQAQRARNRLPHLAQMAAQQAKLEKLGYGRPTTADDGPRRFTGTTGGDEMGAMAAVISPAGGQVMDRLLTDQEAAALLKVGLTTIKKLRSSGDLETVHIGTSARVRLSDVERIVREGCQ